MAPAGCFQPDAAAGSSTTDGALEPPVHLFRRDAAAGDARSEAGAPVVCDAPSGLRALTFVVTTAPVGGRFAPRNVGAIWIQTRAGAFIKTLELWGHMRAKWLSSWLAAGGGDVVDAVTGATLVEHVTHTASWNLKDTHGCEAKAGAYDLMIELTDKSGPGVTLTIPFEKQSAGFVLTPSDTLNFQGMRVTLE